MGSKKTKFLFVIPQTVTLGGIFFGILAISIANENPYGACLAIIAASLCDMLDGRLARLTGSVSNLGMQLDSLADIISFGLAPAYIITHWDKAFVDTFGTIGTAVFIFFFTGSGAIRLARFNIHQEEESSHSPANSKTDTEENLNKIPIFTGIPIPVAGLFLTTYVMCFEELSKYLNLSFFKNITIQIAIIIILSLLMVSKIPYRSFKHFKTKTGRILFFAAIICGVISLIISQPGGTILLFLLIYYCISGISGKIFLKR